MGTSFLPTQDSHLQTESNMCSSLPLNAQHVQPRKVSANLLRRNTSLGSGSSPSSFLGFSLKRGREVNTSDGTTHINTDTHLTAMYETSRSTHSSASSTANRYHDPNSHNTSPPLAKNSGSRDGFYGYHRGFGNSIMPFSIGSGGGGLRSAAVGGMSSAVGGLFMLH